MFIGFLFSPESPRWLVFHGKSEKARRVLNKVRPSEEVDPELEDIIKDYEEFQLSKMGESSCCYFVLTIGSKPVYVHVFVLEHLTSVINACTCSRSRNKKFMHLSGP